jgi:ribosomal protein L7/L12
LQLKWATERPHAGALIASSLHCFQKDTSQTAEPRAIVMESEISVLQVEKRIREGGHRQVDETLREYLKPLILQGRKLDAIKIHKERTRVSLKEAKEAVDEMGRRLHIR